MQPSMLDADINAGIYAQGVLLNVHHMFHLPFMEVVKFLYPYCAFLYAWYIFKHSRDYYTSI